MKVKLSPQQIQNILSDHWWVIALKVAAYMIGLLLAGVGTAQAACLLI